MLHALVILTVTMLDCSGCLPKCYCPAAKVFLVVVSILMQLLQCSGWLLAQVKGAHPKVSKTFPVLDLAWAPPSMQVRVHGIYCIYFLKGFKCE